MQSAAHTSGKTFWDSLHGLRGVALLYVLFSHFGIAGFHLLPIDHGGIGKVGVWIFFGLSAFLLTSRLHSDLKHGGDRSRTAILSFLVHRFFRIYPLYAVVVFAHVLVHDISLRAAFEHLLLISAFQELWAIPIEFKFYFVIPLIALCAVWLGRPLAFAALGIAFLAANISAFDHENLVFSNVLVLSPRLAPFLLGSMLGLMPIDPRDDDPRRVMRFDALGIASIMVLVACTAAYREWIKDNPVSTDIAPAISILIGLAVVGLMRALLANGVLAKMFGLRPLVLLGEISFSVYLLHMFFVRFATRFTVPELRVYWSWGLLAACLVAGTMSYLWIERPGIQCGRRIARRLQARRLANRPIDGAYKERT